MYIYIYIYTYIYMYIYIYIYTCTYAYHLGQNCWASPRDSKYQKILCYAQLQRYVCVKLSKVDLQLIHHRSIQMLFLATGT